MKVVFVGKFFLLMMLLCVTTGSSQQTIDTLSLKIPSEGHLLDVKIVQDFLVRMVIVCKQSDKLFFHDKEIMNEYSNVRVYD